MATSPLESWQPSLLDVAAAVEIDERFATLERIELDPSSWVDHAPAWVSGSDSLFEEVLNSRDWGQRSRRMYDNRVREPRLTAPWSAGSGEELRPPILERMRFVLSERYGVEFDSVGFNLYRDGNDSVAWHGDRIKGDRIKKEIAEPIVALVSLGEPRRLLLHPSGGGGSRGWDLGRGDLFVTGGRTQREWEHSVPKVARAGPRISLAFRHDLDPSTYAN